MKMIISILQDNDKDNVTKNLNEAGYRVTVLPSTGAFFRRGNATLMIGVDDPNVDHVIELIKESTSSAENENFKRATVFVIAVDHFEQV